MTSGSDGSSDSGVPPQLVPVSWLIGRWVGVGTGQYPTIEDFRFGQEIIFSNDGRPFLSYWSRSWLLDADGNQVRPTASESGFVRALPDRTIELLLTHPTGYSEIWEGRVEVKGLVQSTITAASLELRTDVVARTPDAKEYTAGHRLYGLVEGELMWTFDMAAMGQGMGNHLAARLKRAEAFEAAGDGAAPGEDAPDGVPEI